MKTPAKVIEALWAIVDNNDPDGEEAAATTGDETKFPIVAAGVMVYLEGRQQTRKALNEAFSEMVKEFQRRSYLQKGSMKVTAKGLRLTRDLEKTQRFQELMDDYAELLDKVRTGGRKEGYRGPVPLR